MYATLIRTERLFTKIRTNNCSKLCTPEGTSWGPQNILNWNMNTTSLDEDTRMYSSVASKNSVTRKIIKLGVFRLYSLLVGIL